MDVWAPNETSCIDGRVQSRFDSEFLRAWCAVRRPRGQIGQRFMNAFQMVRPLVRSLHPYIPGEQPKIRGLIKLNTNENPYPPAPAVIQAVKNAVDGRLRLYPDPTAASLRTRLASLHRCKPENIIVGNGSDELLAMAVRV